MPLPLEFVTKGGRDAKSELWVRIERGRGGGAVMENRWKIVKGRGTVGGRGGRWPGSSRERDRMFTVNKDRPTGFVDIYS